MDDLWRSLEGDEQDNGKARQDRQHPAQPQSPGQKSPEGSHGQARQRAAGERRERARQDQDDSGTAERLAPPGGCPPHLIDRQRNAAGEDEPEIVGIT